MAGIGSDGPKGAFSCWEVMAHGSELVTGASGGGEACKFIVFIAFGVGGRADDLATSILVPFDDVRSARTGASTWASLGTIGQGT